MGHMPYLFIFKGGWDWNLVIIILDIVNLVHDHLKLI